MSLNQCADQLVLSLLPPGRIASVTYRAGVGAVSPEIAAKAKGVAVNHGLAEEVAAQAPDLIVGGLYTTPAARRLARKAGVPVIDLDAAESFADIRRITRQVAVAVGEPTRGEALIAAMDAELAELARTAPVRPLAVIAWNGSGRVPGGRSLFNDILTAAGAVNLAASDARFETSFDLEQLLALRPQPDLLLYGAAAVTAPGPQGEAARHPVLARAYGDRRIAYPEAAYQCGAPQAAQAARALRQAMLAAVTAEPGR